MSWHLALQQIEHGPKLGGTTASAHTRTCTVCGKTKPMDEFYAYTTNAGAHLRRFKCTLCYRDRKNSNARLRYRNGKFKSKPRTTS